MNFLLTLNLNPIMLGTCCIVGIVFILLLVSYLQEKDSFVAKGFKFSVGVLLFYVFVLCITTLISLLLKLV